MSSEWRDVKKDPPVDGQLVRLRAFVDRDVWYLPSCKFSTWIARTRVDDERPEPSQWKPIKDGVSYYDYHEKD